MGCTYDVSDQTVCKKPVKWVGMKRVRGKIVFTTFCGKHGVELSAVGWKLKPFNKEEAK